MVYAIYCHVFNSVTYPIMRPILGYTNDIKVDHWQNHMALVICMIDNIFMFVSSLPCYFVEVVSDVITLPSYVLKCKQNYCIKHPNVVH